MTSKNFFQRKNTTILETIKINETIIVAQKNIITDGIKINI